MPKITQKYAPHDLMRSRLVLIVVNGQQANDPEICYTGVYEAVSYEHAIDQFEAEIHSVFPKAGDIYCINADRFNRISARGYRMPYMKKPMFLVTREPKEAR